MPMFNMPTIIPDKEIFLIGEPHTEVFTDASSGKTLKLPAFKPPIWHKFTNKIATIETKTGKVYAGNTLHSVKIQHLVIINPDYTISTEIERPNAKCYYLINCVTVAQSRRKLITDGKKYTTVFKLKKDNEFLHSFYDLNKTDKELIKIAINEWHKSNA